MALDQLRSDILGRWGAAGDWNSAGQDQALELARLFEAHGITDLALFGLSPTTMRSIWL